MRMLNQVEIYIYIFNSFCLNLCFDYKLLMLLHKEDFIQVWDDLSLDCSFSACSKYCLIISLQLNVICAACNYQASSGFRPFFELQQQPMVEKINAGLTDPYFPASSIDNDQLTDDYQGKFSTILGVDLASLTQADKAKLSNDTGLKIHDFPLWGDALENGTSGNQAVTFQPSFPETKPDTIGVLPKQENPILGHHFTSNFGERQEIGSHPQVQKLWQVQSYLLFMLCAKSPMA